MPVLITGATGMVGRALATRLLDEGGQVRAYLRRDDPELRAAGVHVAIGRADDVARLEAALTRVHTIAHLVGGSLPERGVSYDWLNRETTEAAVIAANAADVRRFLFLSVPGADPASPNEFLAAKGKGEEHVTGSGLEHAIFRCAPIVGPGSQLEAFFARARRGPVLTVPGPGTQRWNPIGLQDVVAALVAADGRESSVRGVWGLGGPQELSADEVAERVVGPRRKVHLGTVPGAPRAIAEFYAGDLVVDATAAEEHFGLAFASAV